MIRLPKSAPTGREATGWAESAQSPVHTRVQPDAIGAVRYEYHGPRVNRVLDLVQLGKWLVRGCPNVMPDILKRRVVSTYARRFRLDTFVESGTYLGAMVEYMSQHCRTIYSFEYQQRLWKRARERFAGRTDIHILLGSGADLMQSVLAELRTPALFWLDGHFAPGTTAPHEVACPAMEELVAVLRHRPDHVVLIDDAREFRGEGGYSAVGDIADTANSLRPGMQVKVSRDIIRITPPVLD